MPIPMPNYDFIKETETARAYRDQLDKAHVDLVDNKTALAIMRATVDHIRAQRDEAVAALNAAQKEIALLKQDNLIPETPPAPGTAEPMGLSQGEDLGDQEVHF